MKFHPLRAKTSSFLLCLITAYPFLCSASPKEFSEFPIIKLWPEVIQKNSSANYFSDISNVYIRIPKSITPVIVKQNNSTTLIQARKIAIGINIKWMTDEMLIKLAESGSFSFRSLSTLSNTSLSDKLYMSFDTLFDDMPTSSVDTITLGMEWELKKDVKFSSGITYMKADRQSLFLNDKSESAKVYNMSFNWSF